MNIERLSDAELIEQVGHGSHQAFLALYRRCAGDLLTYFARRTLDAESAADLVAETLATVYVRASRFRNTGAPGMAWIYGIARRELAQFRRRGRITSNAMRRLGMERPPLDEESRAAIDGLANLAATRADLEAALVRLDAQDRSAVSLRFIEDKPYAEVAQVLGCSEGAARVRVHRALGRIADALGPYDAV